MATDSSSESKTTPAGADVSARPPNGASTGDKAAGDKAAGDKAAGDKAAGDKAAGDKAAGDKATRPATTNAATTKPAAGAKPAGMKTAGANQATAKTTLAAAGNPAASNPAASNPAASNPAAQAKESAAELRAKVAKQNGSPDAQAKKDAKSKNGAAANKSASNKSPANKDASSRSSALAEFEELEQVGSLSFMQMTPALLVSIVVHMVILLIFGLMVIPEIKKDDRNIMSASAVTKLDDLEDVQDLDDSPPLDIETSLTEVVSTTETITTSESVDPSEVVDTPAPPASVELSDFGIPTAPKTDLLSTIGAVNGKGLDGRGDAMRKQMAASRGASSGSESAVGKALKWLAEHQFPDGGWSFDHRGAPKCGSRCSSPGTLKDARLAATGLALMPFLGQGQTHKQGKYKDAVRGGLLFLCKNMKVTVNGGDMTAGGGAMYGHGICSIALCEAYAMTQDRFLMDPAQAALNFIIYAQDPAGGGWRYSPRTAGDTSVVGWQIMALKSGHLGYLQVPQATVKGAEKFLDFVQTDDGAAYGYDRPGGGAATNAVGLLCRMYMGWPHEDPRLERGVKWLATTGPQPGNMYFNYYASQVLCQYEGPLWEDQWNPKMRDMLVESQSTADGHENGSWVFKGDPGSDPGGRLYSTAMAAMTLEVYYRYMPLYSKKSADDDFAD